MNEVAQITGIGFLLTISTSSLWIAADINRWWAAGRVALTILALYQLVFVFSRTMRLLDWWSPDDVFAFNTIMAGAFAAVFTNIVFMQSVWRKHGLTVEKESI